MIDEYQGSYEDRDDPGESWAAIVPSDTADLIDIPKRLYVTASGNLKIIGKRGSALTFPVTVGQMLDVRPWRVYATVAAPAASVIGIFA